FLENNSDDFNLYLKNKIIMKKYYYIVQLYQIGNVDRHQIKIIDEQPKEGFRTDGQAETFLRLFLNNGKYSASWFSFSIMPFYSKLGQD
ncbi:MAG: hypothetical protein ABIP68_09620, partial [Ferruginibacter sp.]